MAKIMNKGLLITLEGNEGCGKSTQIRLLYRFLRRRGFAVLLTREPGGTVIGDKIRRILLDKKNKRMTAVCETMLYMASRAQLIEDVIKPALEAKRIVLCDRWLDATVAYQGYGAGVDRSWIESAGRLVTGGLKPDLSLFLDLPLKVGLKRATGYKEADRMEQKNLDFHKRVRRGYLAIAGNDPKRVKVIKIDPSESVDAVFEKIRREIIDGLKRH